MLKIEVEEKIPTLVSMTELIQDTDAAFIYNLGYFVLAS